MIARTLAPVLLSALTTPALAAPDDGRTPIVANGIVLPSGSYVLTRNIETGAEPALVVKEHEARVTIDLNGFTISAKDVAVAVDAYNASVTLENGFLAGRITVDGFGNGLIVRNVELDGVTDDPGIESATLDTLVVEQCTFRSMSGGAIDVGANGSGMGQYRIEDCIFRNTGKAIALRRVASATVRGNQVFAVVTTAAPDRVFEILAGSSPGLPSHGCIVERNTIRASATDAVIHLEADDSELRGNTLAWWHSDANYGVRALGDGIRLIDNQVHSVRSGIRLSGQAGIVDGNSVHSAQVGLELIGQPVYRDNVLRCDANLFGDAIDGGGNVIAP